MWPVCCAHWKNGVAAVVDKARDAVAVIGLTGDHDVEIVREADKPPVEHPVDGAGQGDTVLDAVGATGFDRPDMGTHRISQRTAKWLLAAVSRTYACEFAMNQDQLAEMLGIGRTFVTGVVKKLRDEGTIATRRCVFTVKDEDLLRRTACACTTAIENHFDTDLHGIYPSG